MSWSACAGMRKLGRRVAAAPAGRARAAAPAARPAGRAAAAGRAKRAGPAIEMAATAAAASRSGRSGRPAAQPPGRARAVRAVRGGRHRASLAALRQARARGRTPPTSLRSARRRHSSSSWVPSSTTSPSARTMMRSAVRAVCSRCAITTVVRPAGDAVGRGGNPRLGGEVEIRGRLVEQQDRRVDQLRPGEGDQLALADDRERPRSETRVAVTPGSSAMKSVGARRPRRGLDLVVARVGPAVGDVVADRAREQESLLGHVAELAAVGREVEDAKVSAVDEHGSRRRVVETGQQLHHRRLARSRLTHEGHESRRGRISRSTPAQRLGQAAAGRRRRLRRACPTGRRSGPRRSLTAPLSRPRRDRMGRRPA